MRSDSWTRSNDGPRMKGVMLWFDEAKDYGFILTEDEERLYVHRDGFVDGAPVGRCARRPVRLTLTERDGERMAIEVSFVAEELHGRARRRSTTIRSSWG
jgi:hypothetical protein